MHIRNILIISRPRFWLYELGTFFIGVLVAVASWREFFSLEVLFFGLFFLLPANILIYGINDIFDYETDKYNPKKVEYEALLVPEKHRGVWWWIACTCTPFLVAGCVLLPLQSFLWLLVFFFCASFYSATPIRAKMRPGLDSVFSAGHYIATGLVGYYIVAPNAGFPWVGFLGGMAWAIAMHAYSAVPDIEADTTAGVPTIATFLGAQKTILLSGALYILATILFFQYGGWVALFGGGVYIYLMIRSYKIKTEQELFALYRVFPYCNACIPMVWCIYYIVTQRI